MTSRRWSVLLLTVLLAAVPGLARGARAQTRSAAELAEAARAALDAESYGEAIELYEQLHEVLPETAQVPYNLGVAAYRSGDHEQASRWFQRAMELTADPRLSQRSLYNLGNSTYQQSLQALQGQADPQQAATQMSETTGQLEKALDAFKRAAAAEPQDLEARANAELTHRLLEQLRQLQQQQQQQQGQGDEEQPDQQQEPQEQQQQQEQAGDQPQPQDGQPGDQQDNATDQRRGQSAPQPGQDEQEQQQSSTSEPEQPDQEREGQEEQSSDGTNEEHSSGDAELDAQEQRGPAAPMDREEAERLLQTVRDRERQRRQELARQRANAQPPTLKDW